ncbi:hypothetical protein TDB9533_04128 [Thalassocella blandensis]|nr:hypothetical protein TDB9533_04128 [Thalassocella blandensis]
MDQNETLQFMSSLLEVSCLELFEKFGCEVTFLDEVPLDVTDMPMAVVDAGNADFESSLYVHIPFSVLSVTFPIRHQKEDFGEAELEDWVCEIANRILGRLKNKLALYSCPIKTGLPEYYLGTGEGYEVSNISETLDYYFELAGEVCKVTLAIELFTDHINFIENPNYEYVVEDGDIDYLQ